MMHSIVMIGATGAVGGEVVNHLIQIPEVKSLTLLGRRKLEGVQDARIQQHAIDIHTPSSYEALLPGHDTAICTLGVGQPSKMSKEDFLKIDKTAVQEFGSACRKAGVKQFQLLASVGADSSSRSFYLRSKGELEDHLVNLNFDRLSLFHPSMILTPENRYDWKQGLVLKTWPWLKPVLAGSLKKYRGIEVEKLGRAIANNLGSGKEGTEILEWSEIEILAGQGMSKT